MSASTRALLRIREEMTERHLSQRDLADVLHCSQGRIAKILNGGVNLRLDDLDALAKAVGIALTETVRDRGMEFYAEMTPTELRILERIRRRPQAIQAMLVLLDIRPGVEPSPDTRKQKTRGRPLRSHAAKD